MTLPAVFNPPKYRKIRAPKRYLIIGNVQLGYDDDVLKALAVLAETYDAQPIHLGNICTDDEKRMYDRRQNKIRTFEKIASEAEDKLFDRVMDAEGKNYDKLSDKLKDLEAKNASDLDKISAEIEALEAAEAHRVRKLQTIFHKPVWFVANHEQYLLGSHFGKNLVGPKLELSQHLLLESVQANGTKTTSQPITPRAYNYLKNKKISIILPHPTPAQRAFHREGLNKAWNMYTTGALKYQDEASRPSEFYKAVQLPAALLVLIDQNNGEFHTRRLHFDITRCPISHRQKPTILEDGRGFSGAGVWDVGTANIAAGDTDGHAPWEHRGVLASVRSLVDLSQAETYIDDGDSADWTSICPHNAGSPLHAENLRFSDDEESFRRVMHAKADNPCVKTKIFVDANHEDWINRMVAKLPFLVGLMDQASVYARAIPDWTYHIIHGGEDYTYYFGDLAVRHGHNVPSLAYASNLFSKYIGGHVHAHEEYLRCATQGAAASLGPAYLHNSLTKWQNTITSFTKWSEKTAFDIKSVLHDDERKVSRFAFRGDVYEVAWHVYPGEEK